MEINGCGLKKLHPSSLPKNKSPLAAASVAAGTNRLG